MSNIFFLRTVLKAHTVSRAFIKLGGTSSRVQFRA